MRFLSSKIQLGQVNKTCPFMKQQYGIDSKYIPFKKLYYITPQIFKPQLIKHLMKISNSQQCPFLKQQMNQNQNQQKISSTYENNQANQKVFSKNDFYQNKYKESIVNLKDEGRYRVFTPVSRIASNNPKAKYKENLNDNEKQITVWCSNDYMGMSSKKVVVDTLIKVAQETGAGSGGTRNIAGNSFYHLKLEKELADLHEKDNALVCSSGFVANQAAIVGISRVFPDLVIFSDEQNHSSIIEGIKSSKCEKYIFKHNNIDDLEQKLQQVDKNIPKLIIFESVYSMSGSIAPIKEIIQLAKKYNAQTLIDEVHAVGLYGKTGAGLAQQLNLQNQIDFITGTLGKGFGVTGGYIAANKYEIDCIRSHAPNFIFTTSIPPCIAAACQASVAFLKQQNDLRKQLHERANYIKEQLQMNEIPVLKNNSHIIPLFIGNAKKAKMASDMLIKEFNIYLQPINYPTVKRGEEILRISPSPNHNNDLVQELINSLIIVFERLEIKNLQQLNQEKHYKFS